MTTHVIAALPAFLLVLMTRAAVDAVVVGGAYFGLKLRDRRRRT